MKEVVVGKDELLAKLTENREKHIVEFHKAIDGWRKGAVKELQRAIRKLKRLDLTEVDGTEDYPQLYFEAAQDRPECHTKDYDRAIAMLGMHKEDTIKIATKEFDQFVNDEWAWKQAFTISNSKYGI